jgi:hypothetical protein
MASMDSTEKVFVDCLKEIRMSYLEFSKPLRLRIEKWVEKLSLANNKNITWRRHRNAYAKLLLGMVVAKNLSEPFHQMPPDGPLPSFPAQYNHKFKSMLGSHETSFWRELFKNIHDNNSGFSNAPYSDSNLNDEFDTKMAPILQSRADQRMEDLLNRQPLSPSRPINREIQNLTSLIKEQTARIELLEQQLRDERLQHELQIQRLQYAHRIELASYNDVSNFNRSMERSTIVNNAKSMASQTRETEQRANWPSSLSASNVPVDAGYGVDWVNSLGSYTSTGPSAVPKSSTGVGRQSIVSGWNEGSDHDNDSLNNSPRISSAATSNISRNDIQPSGASGAENLRSSRYFTSNPAPPSSSSSSSASSSSSTLSTGFGRQSSSLAAADPLLDFLKSDKTVGEFTEVDPVPETMSSDGFGGDAGRGSAGDDDDYMAYLEKFQADIRSVK